MTARRTYRRRPLIDGMQLLGVFAIFFGFALFIWLILHYALHVL